MSGIELFKELGTYERHFNQMQNVCRGFASTWLLAVFGGFGYLITHNTEGIVDWKVIASLLALSGGTGIFLLWIIDVLVYHRLLLAVAAEAEQLERTEPALPKLRLAMKNKVSLVGP